MTELCEARSHSHSRSEKTKWKAGVNASAESGDDNPVLPYDQIFCGRVVREDKARTFGHAFTAARIYSSVAFSVADVFVCAGDLANAPDQTATPLRVHCFSDVAADDAFCFADQSDR